MTHYKNTENIEQKSGRRYIVKVSKVYLSIQICNRSKINKNIKELKNLKIRDDTITISASTVVDAVM